MAVCAKMPMAPALTPANGRRSGTAKPLSKGGQGFDGSKTPPTLTPRGPMNGAGYRKKGPGQSP